MQALSSAAAAAGAAMSMRDARRVKLVHVAARLPIAGMENVVASLVRGMPSDRYHSAVWCVEEADALGGLLREEGHEVVELGRRSRRDVPLFFRIARLMREQQIDILHCHDELSWFYGAIAARMNGGVRTLVTMHGRRPDISRRHMIEQRALAGITTSIVTVSRFLQQQILGDIKVSSKKAIIIRNGIRLDHLQAAPGQRERARASLGIPEGATVVGTVGRMNGVKNLELLIDAAKQAGGAVPSLYAVLIGEGPCRQALMEKVGALGMQNRVIFTGIRKDVAQLLPAFDMYVCSSDYEGISLSILEAMASGLPVVATAVGGNTEIIRHDASGILVNKRDCHAMSRAITALAKSTERRLKLGQYGRRMTQSQFSLDRMIQDYDNLYSTLQIAGGDRRQTILWEA